jgi:PIN domain nuclease of toxin-antitoxin system
MVTYVLDASAMLRFLDQEAGSERVGIVLAEYLSGRAHAAISALHWGEVVGVLYKRSSAGGSSLAINKLRALNLQVIAATSTRAEASALLKADLRIPYVDSFGVQLAAELLDAVLITADFDTKPAEHLIRIEHLPLKPKP